MPWQVVLWRQKAGTPPHGMVCWDYHCFVVMRATSGSSTAVRVFDLDRRACILAPWYAAASCVHASTAPAQPQHIAIRNAERNVSMTKSRTTTDELCACRC